MRFGKLDDGTKNDAPPAWRKFGEGNARIVVINASSGDASAPAATKARFVFSVGGGEGGERVLHNRFIVAGLPVHSLQSSTPPQKGFGIMATFIGDDGKIEKCCLKVSSEQKQNDVLEAMKPFTAKK
jgi:hypothetical protein